MEQPNWKNHSAFLYAALIVLGAIVLRQIGARVDGLLDLFCNVLRSVL